MNRGVCESGSVGGGGREGGVKDGRKGGREGGREGCKRASYRVTYALTLLGLGWEKSGMCAIISW